MPEQHRINHLPPWKPIHWEGQSYIINNGNGIVYVTNDAMDYLASEFYAGTIFCGGLSTSSVFVDGTISTNILNTTELNINGNLFNPTGIHRTLPGLPDLSTITAELGAGPIELIPYPILPGQFANDGDEIVFEGNGSMMFTSLDFHLNGSSFFQVGPVDVSDWWYRVTFTRISSTQLIWKLETSIGDFVGAVGSTIQTASGIIGGLSFGSEIVFTTVWDEAGVSGADPGAIQNFLTGYYRPANP